MAQAASWELNPDAGYHPQPNRGLALACTLRLVKIVPPPFPAIGESISYRPNAPPVAFEPPRF